MFVSLMASYEPENLGSLGLSSGIIQSCIPLFVPLLKLSMIMHTKRVLSKGPL